MLQRKFNGRQWPLVAEAILMLGLDSAINTAGAEVAFATAGVFDLIPLPPDAVLVGGDVTVDVASNATTQTIAIGDSVNPTRYLAATDVKTVARTPLVLTGYRGNGEDLRVTLAGTGAATAGQVSIRAQYVIRDRANENQPS